MKCIINSINTKDPDSLSEILFKPAANKNIVVFRELASTIKCNNNIINENPTIYIS